MKYAIRIDLKKGRTFGFFQVRELITKSKLGKEITLIDPSEHTIIMHNCYLHNSASTSQKIYEGKMHKAVCAWVCFESYEVLPKQNLQGTEISFSPRVKPYFECEKMNIDKTNVSKIFTNGKKLYK